MLIFSLFLLSLTVNVNAKSVIRDDTVIINQCKLSNLVNNQQMVTEKKKQEFIPNCIQGIIRFVIIMFCLLTILRIAFIGISQLSMNDSAINPIRIEIQNIVIGIALLTFAWNLLPIINASLGNMNFLQLPKIGV